MWFKIYYHYYVFIDVYNIAESYTLKVGIQSMDFEKEMNILQNVIIVQIDLKIMHLLHLTKFIALEGLMVQTLSFQKHKDKFIRSAIIELLPKLASYPPQLFVSCEYLMECLILKTTTQKTKECFFLELYYHIIMNILIYRATTNEPNIAPIQSSNAPTTYNENTSTIDVSIGSTGGELNSIHHSTKYDINQTTNCTNNTAIIGE